TAQGKEIGVPTLESSFASKVRRYGWHWGWMWFSVSPDRSRLLWTEAHGQRRMYYMTRLDRTGTLEIPQRSSRPAWLRDGSGWIDYVHVADTGMEANTYRFGVTSTILRTFFPGMQSHPVAL